MRARAANNFTTEDLKKIVAICKENNVRTYLALNTVMYDHDINLMKKICDTAKEAGLTAVILSDVAALQYARSINLEVHMSTQTNITNIEAVKFYAQYSDVIVLARELTLQQITSICDQIKRENIVGPSGNLIQIEIFVHGALCVAISGKCYMSLATNNASANRGACVQNCRRTYILKDEETGAELKVDNKYIMSPKDLCTIGFIDKILEAGVSVLKIEGRGRAPEYVDTVVRCYKEAVDAYHNDTYNQKKIANWIGDLEKVYNRGFWHGGYYLGKQLGEWSASYGSQAKETKTYLGRVENYYPKAGVGYFELKSGKLNLGDKFIVNGPTTGVLRGKVESIFVDEKNAESAEKGQMFTMPVHEKIRENDKLFLVESNSH